MKNILVEAHRGYSAKYPENTLLAFEKATNREAASQSNLCICTENRCVRKKNAQKG